MAVACWAGTLPTGNDLYPDMGTSGLQRCCKKLSCGTEEGEGEVMEGGSMNRSVSAVGKGGLEGLVCVWP